MPDARGYSPLVLTIARLPAAECVCQLLAGYLAPYPCKLSVHRCALQRALRHSAGMALKIKLEDGCSRPMPAGLRDQGVQLYMRYRRGFEHIRALVGPVCIQLARRQFDQPTHTQLQQGTNNQERLVSRTRSTSIQAVAKSPSAMMHLLADAARRRSKALRVGVEFESVSPTSQARTRDARVYV